MKALRSRSVRTNRNEANRIPALVGRTDRHRCGTLVTGITIQELLGGISIEL